MKGGENHSLTGYKNHQIHGSEHAQTPALLGNLFTLPQRGYTVNIGIKDYNRYYSKGSEPGKNWLSTL